jgi:hypothetical protein
LIKQPVTTQQTKTVTIQILLCRVLSGFKPDNVISYTQNRQF